MSSSTTAKPTFKDVSAEMCRQYVKDGKPEKTEEDRHIHKMCCDLADYCSFWVQPWFWYTIAIISLTLLVVCIVSCVCSCCCKGRLCGGIDLEGQKDQKKESDEEVDSSEDSCESD